MLHVPTLETVCLCHVGVDLDLESHANVSRKRALYHPKSDLSTLLHFLNKRGMRTRRRRRRRWRWRRFISTII